MKIYMQYICNKENIYKNTYLLWRYVIFSRPFKGSLRYNSTEKNIAILISLIMNVEEKKCESKVRNKACNSIHEFLDK